MGGFSLLRCAFAFSGGTPKRAGFGETGGQKGISCFVGNQRNWKIWHLLFTFFARCRKVDDSGIENAGSAKQELPNVRLPESQKTGYLDIAGGASAIALAVHKVPNPANNDYYQASLKKLSPDPHRSQVKQ